jgi:hypothetical protein
MLVQISRTKNGYEWALASMKSEFEPTKFEETPIPNTMAALPGLGSATKRSNMREHSFFANRARADGGGPEARWSQLFVCLGFVLFASAVT